MARVWLSSRTIICLIRFSKRQRKNLLNRSARALDSARTRDSNWCCRPGYEARSSIAAIVQPIRKELVMSIATSQQFVSPLKRAAVAAAIVLGMATTAQSAQRDYYVHFSAYNPDNGVPGNYVTASITADQSGGKPLQRPAGACGMRFESVDDTDWLTPIPYAPDFHGSINVWLPSKDCGAWNTVVIERDN